MTAPTLEEFEAALNRLTLQYGEFHLTLKPSLLVTLIGAVQVALRHPAFPSTSRLLLTDWIEQVAAQIPDETVRQVIANGFHEEFDQ